MAANAAESRWRFALKNGVMGAAFGLLVLHPVARVLCRLLDPSVASSARVAQGNPLWRPLIRSFEPALLPMGIVFALICAVAAIVNACHRRRLAAQGADLKQKTKTLREQNQRLVELECANHRATRFLVHDFKTPLGTILGFTEILMSRGGSLDDTSAKDALSRIRRQAARLLDAVGSLLDLSRMRGAASLNRSAVQVDRLIEEARDACVFGSPAAVVEVGPGASRCPRIDADVRVMRRVLINLVANALKHNVGDITVRLDARPADNEIEVIMVCTDDGRGIPDDVVPQLFRDSPGNGSGVRPASGCVDSNGLGLTFCREAVEAHGGRIWYERTGGRGARFCFTVQIAKGEDGCPLMN